MSERLPLRRLARAASERPLADGTKPLPRVGERPRTNNERVPRPITDRPSTATERDLSRREELFVGIQERQHRETDRLFGKLLIAQWVFAIVLALIVSPWSYTGQGRTLHPHVLFAIVFGFLINMLPLALIWFRPGWWGTRQTVAVVQMMWSALLIMITGGRIETHFHVFGSLAFLGMYRDWRVLPTASAVVAIDHLARGLWWPDSVYGLANPEWWRFLEHAGWVAFEDTVLLLACFRGLREMRETANREARLERMNMVVEGRVRERTEQLLEGFSRERQLEVELRQAQKLESVGRLAAGVAHEINTPVQFVSDSVEFVRSGVDDLVHIVRRQQEALDQISGQHPVVLESAVLVAAVDLPYLVEEMPKALDRATDGLDRVSTIVRSMKVFAHSRGGSALVDLNYAVESTLTIARNEYRYIADLETRFGELPPVWCQAGEINQAVLNVVINAAHAISDVVASSGGRGKLTVETRRDGDDVVISIGDTGGGIPHDVQQRMFDPFFTTKQVGRGTGQGLAITHNVIVDKHRGSVTCDSMVGAGTTFHLRFPVDSRVGSLQETGAAA